MRIPRSIFLLTSLAVLTPLVGGTQEARVRPSAPWLKANHSSHAGHGTISGTLVDQVRQATERYRDIGAAIADGWVPGSPCVSGPNEGAMGVHYVQPTRIGDGVLRADEPEALIYEPLPGGRLRLVGVEFIEIAETWDSGNATPPALEGHLFNFVGAPNRYGLPAFYELHVWAWQTNPNGRFADWNTLVSCELQPGD